MIYTEEEPLGAIPVTWEDSEDAFRTADLKGGDQADFILVTTFAPPQDSKSSILSSPTVGSVTLGNTSQPLSKLTPEQLIPTPLLSPSSDLIKAIVGANTLSLDSLQQTLTQHWPELRASFKDLQAFFHEVEAVFSPEVAHKLELMFQNLNSLPAVFPDQDPASLVLEWKEIAPQFMNFWTELGKIVPEIKTLLPQEFGDKSFLLSSSTLPSPATSVENKNYSAGLTLQPLVSLTEITSPLLKGSLIPSARENLGLGDFSIAPRNSSTEVSENTLVPLSPVVKLTLPGNINQPSQSIPPVVTPPPSSNNSAPINLTLSGNTVSEDAPGAFIGVLTAIDPDAGDTWTYQIVGPSQGLMISGDILQVDPVGSGLDYEAGASKSINIKVTDQTGNSYTKAMLINVLDVNDLAPTDITLSSNTIAENIAAGSTVGTFSPVDGDTVGTYTYSLVAGAGSTDNTAFTITGNALNINASPDFETKSSYSIRVQVNDGVNTFQKVFTVTVTDVNEAPTNIALSSTSIAENVAAGGTIGTFSTTDPDTGNTFTYSLVAGTGSTDNGAFSITGNALTINASPNFEAQSSYSIRVQVNDGVNTFEKQFTITISDVNESPTNISLSSTTVAENDSSGTVGTFSTTDPDTGNTFTYSLVAGTGSTDNGAFSISGNTLKIFGIPDFEAKPSYSIRVQVSDGVNTFEKIFTINVTDVNEAPTNIALSSTTIAENIAAGSTVGTFSTTDPDTGNTFTYSLVAGTGSTDNAAFTITGNALNINASPDFETKSSYSIRVQVNDGVNTFQKVFTINISDVNEAPTDIALSSTIVTESTAAGSTVGTFSTTDPDTGNTFTYSLVGGTGSPDNSAFTITGNTLTINASPDFDVKQSYSIRVQVNDGLNTFEKVFTINVSDVNVPPTDIVLSNNSIAENVAAGATIGTFSAIDPDTSDVFTYSLVAGTGATDNAAFTITGSTLTINASPDFEAKSSYSIRVQVNDGLNTFEKVFTVNVTNVNEAPTDITLSPTTFAENDSSGTVGTFSTTDPDTGNTFTYSLVAGTGSTDNSAFSISGNTLKGFNSPDFETKSSYSIRVQVDDGVNTFEKVLTINITDVNETPTNIALSSTTIAENVAAGSTVGTFSTTDPDTGNTFTYTLVGGTGSTDNANFTITGNTLTINNSPDFEAKSSYSIRVQVNDGVNNFQKVFTITISDVNEAPTDIALSSAIVTENTAAGSTVGTFSTTDPDTGNTFTYSLVSGLDATDNAAFTITGNALTINASPDFDVKQSYSIRVQVNDGVNNFQKVFTITVSNVNEAPTDIALSNNSIAENVAAGSTVGTLSTSDPDTSDVFTYSLVAGTGSTDNSAFTITGNSLNINASPDFEAKSSYSIRVQVNDGLNTFEKVFTINVTNVNEAPTNISLSSTTVAENDSSGTIGTFSTTDPDIGNTFTYSLVSGAGSTDNSAFSISGNTLKIFGIPDFEAKPSYSIRVQVSDGVNTFEKVFTINVTDVNEAPTNIALSSTTIAENVAAGSTVGTFSTTDPDTGNTFTYSLVAGTGSTDNAAFTITGNALTINASPDFETKSSYSIRVQVNDGVNTFQKIFTVTVTDVNEAPTNIALSATTIAENVAAGSTVGTFTTTDPDTGNTFTYSLVAGTGSTDNAAFTITGNALTINASPDFETKSSYSIRVQVNDGVNTFQKIFTVTVTDVNEAPTNIALSATTIAENVAAGATVGTFSTTDPDTGNTFTYSLVAGTGSTDNGAFTITGNTLTINASPDFETKSSYSICVQVNDGVNTFQKIFTVTVTDVNEAPTNIALSATTIAENVAAGATVGTFSTTDPDTGNTFTYSLVAGTGSTDNGAFSITGNALTINASPDFETKSSYSIRVQVNDGVNTFQKIFTVTVTDVNEAPTNIALSATTIAENVAAGATVGTFTTTDPDTGNTFTYSLVAGTGSTDNAAFTITGNALTINASPDFEAQSSYAIRIRTTDQNGLSFEKQFTIAVSNVNEGPTDIIIPASVSEGSALVYSNFFSSNDPDAGATLTYTLVAGAGSTDNGSFAIIGSDLHLVSAFDFETKSTYNIRVQVSDGTNTFEKALTINITNVNEAPTDIALSSTTIAENSAAGTTVGTFSTTDPDAGNTFTYSLVSGTGSIGNSAFSISGSNLNITASANFEGPNSYSIRVRATDQGGLTFEKVFTITVTNVNETPTNITLSATAIAENVAAGSTIGTFSSTDPDAGSTFTYSLVAGTGSTDNGAFTITGNTLTINGIPNFEGQSSYSIRVRTTDQNGLFFEKQFTVTITDVNEVPVIGGITALTNMFDTNTTTPFSNVTLSDPENNTVTVTITFPINGTLAGGGFNVSVPGTATFTGTVAAAQAAIRALVFNPTDTTGAGSLGNDITTAFTITVTDGLLPTSNNSTIIHVTQGLGSAAANTFTLPFAISTGGLLDAAGGTDSVTLAAGTNTFSVANLENLIGGSGADTITYTTALAAGATIDLNGGIDTVILSTAGNNTVAISDVENISVASSTARVDTITFGSAFLFANNSVVDLGQGTDSVSLYGGGAVGNSVKLQNVESISINNNVGNQQVVTVEVDASGVTSSTISAVTLGTNTANQIYFNSFNAFDGTTNVNYNITVDGTVNSILSNDFGIGNDTFTYTAAFATGKFVNGGLGSDTIVLSNTTQTFTTTGISAVEQIKTPVSATSNYNITIADATVATTTGLTFKVDASTTSGTATINGSAVTSGNLTLMGGSGANTLTGGSGDDTLSSAAGVTSNINIFQGGIGNDILQYNGNMGATAVYNGGSGNADVLSFLGSTNQSLNLNTASATNVVDIEVIDMTGAGTNTLTLNASEVLGISSTSNTLRILGTNVDTVTQTNGAGTWISDGQVVIESNTYNQYHNSASPTAILQIQASITNFIP